jgi:hypothetical protein
MTNIDFSGCRSAAEQELLRDVVQTSFGDIYATVWGNMVAKKPYIIAYHASGKFYTFGINTTLRQATL